MIEPVAYQAGRIARQAVDQVRSTAGVGAARSMAVAFLCAWGVALRSLIGAKLASEQIYQLADQIAAPDEPEEAA